MRPPLPPMIPRYAVQCTFLTFFFWIGWKFSAWVSTLEQGGNPTVLPPAAVEGFLPISGLAGLRFWLQNGSLHPVHPAAALLLLAALLTALLLKRGFCSWICPVFPLSEGLWRLGRKLFGRNFFPPLWLDLPLRGIKYLLLGFFLWQILWMMPLPALQAFLGSAYHKIVDIRMLRFFLHPSTTLVIVLALFLVTALLVQMPWCRYFCPYGALLGLVSLLSLVKIRRNTHYCVRCGACSSHCPAWLPVMLKTTVRSPECFACYSCVQSCPAPGALQMSLLGRVGLPSLVFGLLLLSLFLGVDLYGRSQGRWHNTLAPAEARTILRSMGP